MNQVAQIERRSITTEMAGRYGMEPVAFEAVLRATVLPKVASKEEFAAYLLIAKEYNLNPMTREIYAFPKKGGGLSFVVSVDGWANIINSHPAANGMTFRDVISPDGQLVAICCQMWRKDREHPIEATEYMDECRRSGLGADAWHKWPRRMLRHKAMVQAARYAYGFAGIIDQDEAERFEKTYPADKRQAAGLAESLRSAATPRPPQPTTPPPPPPPEDDEDEDDSASGDYPMGYDTVEERDMDRERLWDAGKAAAEQGMASLGTWAATLTREQRDKLGADYSAELTRLAKEAHVRDEAAAGGGVT